MSKEGRIGQGVYRGIDREGLRVEGFLPREDKETSSRKETKT